MVRPPPPASAKKHNARLQPKKPRRTMWQIYKAVPPRYRILLGMGFMGFSMVGMWASDKLENMFPPPAENRVTHIAHSSGSASAQSEDPSKQSKKP
ncbi:hypothetical protein EV175_003144 [Coemansia sp. RSA 1933]|nr:hypothetical protein EV175_003144 [Coemansia sp. RSA 1933]